MSMKKNLQKEIAIVEEEIKELENKRMRSMAALLEALISKSEPQEKDMQFFRQYSAGIEVKRAKLGDMIERLKLLR